MKNFRFLLYLKLFVITGTNWSMEVISWLVSSKADNTKQHWVFYVSDLVNTLQGVLIFVTFVCRKRVALLLLERFGCASARARNQNTNSGVTYASYSDASQNHVTTAQRSVRKKSEKSVNA